MPSCKGHGNVAGHGNAQHAHGPLQLQCRRRKTSGCSGGGSSANPTKYKTGSSNSTAQHDPGGCVIARAFLAANPSIYAPLNQPIARCWSEQEMIQPHPFV